jgi:hypothetical protein
MRAARALAKFTFVAVLFIAVAVIAVPLGNMAVRGIANTLGDGPDATYCKIYEANQCSSVSLGEIDVTRRDRWICEDGSSGRLLRDRVVVRAEYETFLQGAALPGREQG